VSIRHGSPKPHGSLVKIHFEHLQNADGDWPPYDTETLWAHNLGLSRYRLDNTPWFVYGVAFGDVVSARQDREAGSLVFETVIQRSGHSTLRAMSSVGSPERFEDALATLADLGCSIEYCDRALAAIDVPREVSGESVIIGLEAASEAGILDFEEGYLFG
jgi:uncharacterized protein DUF4265